MRDDDGVFARGVGYRQVAGFAVAEFGGLDLNQPDARVPERPDEFNATIGGAGIHN
ncbi:hypothetical protein D3C72_2536210 [compost metagenome]